MSSISKRTRLPRAVTLAEIKAEKLC